MAKNEKLDLVSEPTSDDEEKNMELLIKVKNSKRKLRSYLKEDFSLWLS